MMYGKGSLNPQASSPRTLQTVTITAYDQPALGGVYKLSAIRKADGTWDHKI
jgi:hypothetical protein